MVKLCVAKNYANKGIDTEKKYYVTDPHGSVVQLTDENGKVTKTYEYDSFGNEVKPDKKDENPFRYCGEYYDKETEEVYLRARYYQPKKGRFLTRDTYTGEEDEPESLHLYVYCGNDGVNSIDPSGHKKKAIILIGSDVESSDNGFIDNANTWKYKHRNYDCKQYLCWKSDSLEELFQKIVKKNKKRKANRLLIMAHSDSEHIELSSSYKRKDYPDIEISQNTDLSSLKKCLKGSAKIYMYGCNAGGMAGYKNVYAYIKNKKYTGRMAYYQSIAQTIANKTKRKSYAYVNFTSQKKKGAFYYQKPVNRYNEPSVTFKYYKNKIFVKKRRGKVENKFFKFNPNSKGEN